MKTLHLLFSSVVALLPTLPACSADATSADPEVLTPTAAGSETHTESYVPCDQRRRQIQAAACANYNSGTGTCDYQCLSVDLSRCVLVYGYPDASTACSGRADCRQHACDGAGSCIAQSANAPDGTYCDTNVCSTYGYSQCHAGACSNPICYWPGGPCDTRSGTFCSTQPVCTSTSSCW